jgi:hypothetical protein
LQVLSFKLRHWIEIQGLDAQQTSVQPKTYNL